MLSAVRSRMLSRVVRCRLPPTAHAPSHPPLFHHPVRRQGWWTPPGGGGGSEGLPPGFSSRWVTSTTYELTVDMGQGSGGVSYDTSVGPNGEIHIKATWGDGQVAHLRHSLPPGVDPASVKTTLGKDGIIKITASLK